MVNDLGYLPGPDGVPMIHAISRNEIPDLTISIDLPDIYVSMSTLSGEYFATNSANMHNLITKFISGNDEAEKSIQALIPQSNGRLDFISLQEQYEGFGANVTGVMNSEGIQTDLLYSGDKKPHMWWYKLKKVDCNNMMIIILNGNVKADF